MVNSNETSRIGQRMYGECASQLHRAVRRIRCSFFWGAHCDNEQKKNKRWRERGGQCRMQGIHARRKSKRKKRGKDKPKREPQVMPQCTDQTRTGTSRASYWITDF